MNYIHKSGKLNYKLLRLKIFKDIITNMMNLINVNIDVDKIFGAFLDSLKLDEEKKDLKIRLTSHLKKSFQLASMVQCVGMPNPLPIDKLYQEINLYSKAFGKKTSIYIEDLLKKHLSFKIRGGPGSGKTTLMHWIFVKYIQQSLNPILFTVRNKDEFDLLIDLLRLIKNKKIKYNIYLLVDGYDELVVDDRKTLSQELQIVNSTDNCRYIITCRNFYEVYDLKSPEFYLKKFNSKNIRDFSESFFTEINRSIKSNSGIDVDEFISELKQRDFDNFLSSPLMLTLACVVKSTKTYDLPRSTIGLVKRAVDTLTFRWDESRGVNRFSQISVSGEERVSILKYLAYYSGIKTTEIVATNKIKDQLLLIQKESVNPTKLLDEIAKFYGIYIPLEEQYWGFTQKVMFDFFYAKYWVESGTFDLSDIRSFDSKAAYAACMLPNATHIIEESLKENDEVHFLVDTLLNGAAYSSRRVAKALVGNIDKYKSYEIEETHQYIIVSTNKDVFKYASNQLLDEIISYTQSHLSPASIVCSLYTMNELLIRKNYSMLGKINTDNLSDKTIKLRRNGIEMAFSKKEIVYLINKTK